MARKPKSEVPPKEYREGWLSQLDNRTTLANAMRERYSALCNDLGGVDRLSYAQRSLCERSLWLEYWLAQQEQELAAGKEFNVSAWVQAANSLQGIYTKLGLERRTKSVPDLHEYLARREAE